MAFWDSWFAPKCEGCGSKIVGVAPVAHDGKKLCPACHERALEAAAKKQADIEARRLAEEEARRKLEDGKQFGADKRLGSR